MWRKVTFVSYLERRRLSSLQRVRRSLVSSLSKVAIINLLSHPLKVVTVIYKESRGQGSTYSLLLLIIL